MFETYSPKPYSACFRLLNCTENLEKKETIHWRLRFLTPQTLFGVISGVIITLISYRKMGECNPRSLTGNMDMSKIMVVALARLFLHRFIAALLAYFALQKATGSLSIFSVYSQGLHTFATVRLPLSFSGPSSSSTLVVVDMLLAPQTKNPHLHKSCLEEHISQEDVNGEKLTVKEWWIWGADFFTVYADFSRFVSDINGEKKNISLLMIFFTVSFSRFAPSWISRDYFFKRWIPLKIPLGSFGAFARHSPK